MNEIKVPVFSCDDFMMHYAVFGFTKIAEEQGEWAAYIAREILDGKKPFEVPLTRNKRTKVYINQVLAAKQYSFPMNPLSRQLKYLNDWFGLLKGLITPFHRLLHVR